MKKFQASDPKSVFYLSKRRQTKLKQGKSKRKRLRRIIDKIAIHNEDGAREDVSVIDNEDGDKEDDFAIDNEDGAKEDVSAIDNKDGDKDDDFAVDNEDDDKDDGYAIDNEGGDMDMDHDFAIDYEDDDKEGDFAIYSEDDFMLPANIENGYEDNEDTDHTFVPNDEDLEVCDRNIAMSSSTNKNNAAEIRGVLEVMGLGSYLRSIGGGKRTESSTKTILGRTAQFIQWCFGQLREVFKPQLAPESMEMVKYTFFHVIDRHFSLLDGYCESQLIQRSKFKAQTVSNHLMDLLSAARWYVFNRTDFDSHLQCDRAGFTGFHEHLKNINKHFKREAKRETPPKTFADAVEEGKLPLGGLPSLQNAVVKVLPLVNRLLTQEKMSHQKTTRSFSVLYLPLCTHSRRKLELEALVQSHTASFKK